MHQDGLGHQHCLFEYYDVGGGDDNDDDNDDDGGGGGGDDYED